VTCAGRVFGVASLLGRIYRLGPDLTEDRSADLGKVRDVAHLLGADDRNLYVFFDNTLVAYDAELKPAGRVVLEPEKLGEIVPVISADDFRIFAGKAYLLASNTGEVYAIELRNWTAERVRLPRGYSAGQQRIQWIDSGDGTLNILVSQRREEHTADLEAAETRVIETEVVLTLALADLRQAPRETVLHEQREIHKPYPPGFLDEVERKNAQGIIIEYPPPYHQERPPQGIHVSRVSLTAPCFAEVFVEDEHHLAAFGSRKFVVLGSGGKTTNIECFRDEKHAVVWFKCGREVHVLAPKVRDRQLNLQGASYLKLLDLPDTADAAVLAF
jgi:hypothetical protein